MADEKTVNVKIEHKSGCAGCWTALLVLLAIGIVVQAWESSDLLVRILLVIGTLAVIGAVGWVIDAKEKKAAAAAKEAAK